MSSRSSNMSRRSATQSRCWSGTIKGPSWWLLVAACASLPQLAVAQNIGWSGLGWRGASLAAVKGGADRGDKHAQLELGIRYEEGRGVPADKERARKLYRAAARTTPQESLFYSPGGADGAGRVVRLANPASGKGLAEAQARLDALTSGKRSMR